MIKVGKADTLREYLAGRTVAGCPHLTVSVLEEDLPSLLDSGSHCSLMALDFFDQYVLPKLGRSEIDRLQHHNFFKLSAAQGSTIPLAAYVELDVNYDGFLVPKVPFLVTQPSSHLTKGQAKYQTPGLIGSNYLRLACDKLMREHGRDVFLQETMPNSGITKRLWHTLAMYYFQNMVKSDGPETHVTAGISSASGVTNVSTRNVTASFKGMDFGEASPVARVMIGDAHRPLCIPANSGITVSAHVKALKGRLPKDTELLIENDGPNNLPQGLVVNSTMVTPRRARAPVVLLNTTTQNIWVRQNLAAATAFDAELVSPDVDLDFNPTTEGVEVTVNAHFSQADADNVKDEAARKGTSSSEKRVNAEDLPGETTQSPNGEVPKFGPEPDYGDDFDFETEVGRLPFKLNLDKDAELDRAQQIRFIQLCYANTEVFSLHEEDLGFCDVIKHDIQVTDPKPVYLPHRTIPFHLKEQVMECLQHWIKQGIIRPSHSPYASQIVIVKKKDGKVRVCVDYRGLNNVVVRDAFPLPRIEETLNAVHEAMWFTSFDLAQGYLQLAMEPDAMKYTAFRAGSSALYEFTRMPFGLSNAVSTFSRLMEMCLGDQQFLTLLLYLDDICIFAKDKDQMLDRIEMVFARLKKFGLKIKPSKTFFFKKEALFLGHLLTAAGIRPNPEKIDKIKDWPRPTTVKELHSFIGLASYYRRFVQNFAAIAGCLHAFLGPTSGHKGKKGKGKKKGTDQERWVYNPRAVLDWKDEHEAAFEELKEALTTSPVLAYPDFSKPFFLEVDASFDGLGAILSQESTDGKVHPVAYASRSLRPNEKNMQNYSSAKLELLGMKWAITEKFRDYLLGAKFTVITDNNPLAYVKTSRLGSAMVRWMSELALFDFNIKFRSGKDNPAADALSRRPGNPEEEDREDEEIAISFQVVADTLDDVAIGTRLPTELRQAIQDQDFADDNAIYLSNNLIQALPEISQEDMRSQQEQDPVIKIVRGYADGKVRPTLRTIRAEKSKAVKRYLNQFDRLRYIHGVLFRQVEVDGVQSQQLCLPNNLQYRVFVSLHRDAGHQSLERTHKLIAERVYWPGMFNDIEAWTKKCTRCLVAKPVYHGVKPIQGSILPKNPMDLLCIDFTVMDKDKAGRENVLVCTDGFSKFSQAFVTSNQTAITVAKILSQSWFLPYGIPKRIHSDRGRNFEALVVRSLCALYGIKTSQTTSYNPRGNSICERFNRTLHGLIRTLRSEHKNSWPTHLPGLILAYNATPNDTTGIQPYQLMFGRKMSMPCDSWLGLGTYAEYPNKSTSQWLQEQEEILRAANKRALKAMKDAAKERIDRAGGTDLTIPTGNLVLRRWHPEGRHKVADHYGSTKYVVLSQQQPQVYVIEPVGGGVIEVVNRRQLKDIGQMAPKDLEQVEDVLEDQSTDGQLGVPLLHPVKKQDVARNPAARPPVVRHDMATRHRAHRRPVVARRDPVRNAHPAAANPRPVRKHQLPIRYRRTLVANIYV